MAQRRTPIEAGELDRVVTLQQRGASDAVDSAGAPVETWTTLAANIPACKRDVRGGERFMAEQLAASFDTRWEIHWRTDMDPDTVDVPKLRRVLHGSRVYDIVYASEIGRREGIELSTLAKP
jgi:hypothetical protein